MSDVQTSLVHIIDFLSNWATGGSQLEAYVIYRGLLSQDIDQAHQFLNLVTSKELIEEGKDVVWSHNHFIKPRNPISMREWLSQNERTSDLITRKDWLDSLESNVS